MNQNNETNKTQPFTIRNVSTPNDYALDIRNPDSPTAVTFGVCQYQYGAPYAVWKVVEFHGRPSWERSYDEAPTMADAQRLARVHAQDMCERLNDRSS